MIYLIIGTNAYRAQYELQQLVKALDVRPEKIDAASLDLNKLADTVRGLSLFQERRLIVIERLSERKDLWDKLGEWTSDIAAETYLVLIEPRPDKRTKTFKTLQKTAKLIEATPLNLADRICRGQKTRFFLLFRRKWTHRQFFVFHRQIMQTDSGSTNL